MLGLREHLFGHLTTLSLRYFSEQRAGWIISRLTNDVDALSDVLSEGLSTLVANTLTLHRRRSIALFVARLAPRRSSRSCPAADAGGLALVPGPLARRLRRRPQPDRRVTAQIAESLAGMAVIQSFNREGVFRASSPS